MKKLFFVLLCGACATACVDNDYDLGKVDTDNIAIGDETSCFEAPLAEISVSMTEINSDNNIRIDEIFNEADIWLPTQLPDQDDNGRFVYVQRLLNDQAYRNDNLLPLLIDEMVTNPDKLDKVADLLQAKYYTSFSELLPGVSQQEFKSAFVTVFSTNETLRELLAAQVRTLANDYLTTLDVNMDDLSYAIDRIDLSDDVINMLADNLDPAETPDPKNTLHLAGSIDNRLPVTLQISPSFPPTQIVFTPTTIAANTDANELPETRLQADDLRTIVRGITVNIPLVLEKYYPGKGFGDSLSEEESQVVIHLHLIKRGALKFDL